MSTQPERPPLPLSARRAAWDALWQELLKSPQQRTEAKEATPGESRRDDAEREAKFRSTIAAEHGDAVAP